MANVWLPQVDPEAALDMKPPVEVIAHRDRNEPNTEQPQVVDH